MRCCWILLRSRQILVCRSMGWKGHNTLCRVNHERWISITRQTWIYLQECTETRKSVSPVAESSKINSVSQRNSPFQGETRAYGEARPCQSHQYHKRRGSYSPGESNFRYHFLEHDWKTYSSNRTTGSNNTDSQGPLSSEPMSDDGQRRIEAESIYQVTPSV